MWTKYVFKANQAIDQRPAIVNELKALIGHRIHIMSRLNNDIEVEGVLNQSNSEHGVNQDMSNIRFVWIIKIIYGINMMTC